MTRFNRTSLATAVGLAVLGLAQVTEAKDFSWTTVVNNGFFVPACAQTDGTRLFNSYSQPSINEAGLVAFRGRSKGSDGGGGEGGEALALAAPEAEVGAPARGVYSRDMGKKMSPINVVACVRSAVPDPNNLYGAMEEAEVLGTFNEFPAFPRMDATSSSIATRGQSTPVYEYVYGVDAEGNELTSKVGTSGVYVQFAGELLTGASLLGAAPVDYPGEGLAFSEYSVPGEEVPEGTRFDQFPGSPTIADETMVAFKGNFTVGDGKTGVFFRDVSDDLNPTYLVANSLSTVIPGTTSQVFGSTAPPSAAGGYVFFIGSDNEDNPTQGGLYRASMDTGRDPNAEAPLETLVGVQQTGVPGESSKFAKLGEGLSVSKDANLVAFWGTWEGPTFEKQLNCPADGNKDIKAECWRQYPDGYAVVKIPVNQGIFVLNVATGNIVAVAKTGVYGFSDFLYWVFSGAPPGVGSGEGDRELPRWRSSAFAAVSMLDKKNFAVAFKGTQSDVPGIFLGDGSAAPVTVVKLGDDGTKIDPLAPAGSLVTAVGIEREGFRGQNLAITAAMLYEGIDEEGEEVSLGWAGIYLTRVKSLK